MQKRISILAMVFLLASLGIISNAAAAMENEPLSIQELMDQLSDKLHLFAQSNVINSRGKVVWCLAIRPTLLTVQNTAQQSTVQAAMENNPHQRFGAEIINDVQAAVKNTNLNSAIEITRLITQGIPPYLPSNFAFDEIQIAALEAARKILVEGGTIPEAEKAAEKSALIYIVTNADRIIESNYQVLFNSAATFESPFSSTEAWSKLNDCTYDTMCLLSPWLIEILPINWIPECHKTLFLRRYGVFRWPLLRVILAGQEEGKIFNEIPKELRELIILFLIQVGWGKVEE